MSDPSDPPKRVNWFLIGALFGLVAYPFYEAVLGPDPASKRKKLKAA